MRQGSSGHEIEIKLRVPDARKLGLRLKQLRAREITPRSHESNTLYDTPESRLTRGGQLIRVRVEHVVSKSKRGGQEPNSQAILTYKGPSQRSLSVKGTAKKSKNRFKIREEVEVVLSGPNEMTRVLRALGLHPVFRYEKFRTTYALPGIRNVKVEVDETPVGLFVELEGSKSAIDRAARCLGYFKSDYMTDTYGALYIADCRRHGTKARDMLFRSIKKLQYKSLFP